MQVAIPPVRERTGHIGRHPALELRFNLLGSDTEPGVRLYHLEPRSPCNRSLGIGIEFSMGGDYRPHPFSNLKRHRDIRENCKDRNQPESPWPEGPQQVQDSGWNS